MRRLRSGVLTVSVVAVVGGAVPAVADDGDLAAATPQQVLARVKADLAKVRSFHFAGRGSGTRLTADVQASGSARLAITQGRTSAAMVILPKTGYLKANLAYWRAAGGKDAAAQLVARKLAGRWVKVPGGRRALGDVLDGLTPKDLASCIDHGTGTLTNEGARTLGARKVVVIKDAGDKPGTTPGLLYVSSEGRALPLRIEQTGRTQPGGKQDAKCGGSGSGETEIAEATFSRFDAVRRITAPRGARTVEQIVGSAGGHSTQR